MSIWLQKRLAIWVGAMLVCGALLWNVGALRAQVYENYAAYIREGKKPRQKLTKEQATKRFVSVMNNWPPKGDRVAVSFSTLPSYISLKSKRELKFHWNVAELFQVMVQQWKQPVAAGKNANRPLILVQEEDGGWSVDIIETYARWNNFDVAAKAEAIYKLTGVVLDGLPQSQERDREWCQSKLQQLAWGLAQYVQDYDEKLPPAKQWIDGSVPYVKTGQIFNCPAVTKGRRWGYALNAKYSMQFHDRWKSSSQSVLLYETTILKRNAYGIGENAAFRHMNGANYAFADGHVKWFPKGQTPSFKLKQ
jgi:prepilin-type processing-associated H-X9-DG protein